MPHTATYTDPATGIPYDYNPPHLFNLSGNLQPGYDPSGPFLSTEEYQALLFPGYDTIQPFQLSTTTVEEAQAAQFDPASITIDWSKGQLFGAGGTHSGAPTRDVDPYGGDWSDPFGQFMFGTFGRGGQWLAESAAPAVVAAAGDAGQATSSALGGLYDPLVGLGDWTKDITKLLLLGIAGLAVISVAK